MKFPEAWGPPPSFEAVAVSASGRVQRLTEENTASTQTNCASKVSLADVSAGDKGGCAYLRFYTVDGFPSAGSELLVSEQRNTN